MTQASELAAARAAAADATDDVNAQIRAAYACDRWGDERDAVTYYDAAWKLGVPEAERRNFLVGYGSTLRNVGRLDDAIEILRRAVEAYPEFAPLHAFLSLALHSAGCHRAAAAAGLDAVLTAEGGSNSLDRYDRALRYYRDELRESSGAPHRVAPVFPVRDVEAALELYARLGFETRPYQHEGEDRAVYGFAFWGDVELHLARTPDLDPTRSTSACYLWIDDANVLHARWTNDRIPGRLHPPEDTPYGLREFAYVDPDGNLLRVGSPL